MNTSEVLNRAADLIEERGWTTGQGWDHEAGGPLCLEGAVFAASGVASDHRYTRCAAYDAVKDYLSAVTTKPPFLWNDGLPYGWMHPEGPPEHEWSAWVGGSREAARQYGRERVIETLRAAALIEAAKETDVRVVEPQRVTA